LQYTLFELLGDASFDFIRILLEKRGAIISTKMTTKEKNVDAPTRQYLVGQVIVTSDQSKQLEKQRKKDRKRGQYEEARILHHSKFLF
jgi:hypothetical protein